MRSERFTRARAARVLLQLSALLLACFGVALAVGEQPVSLLRAWAQPDSPEGAIVYQLRLPRALLAGLGGGALAASGCVLQALLRNPLADPFVLGVSGGAALGSTAALALGVGGLQVGFALGGAWGATFVVLALGRAAGGRFSHAVLLAGVIFNAFALAVVMFVKVLVAPDRLGEVLYWLAGAIGHERLATLGWAALAEGAAVGGLWLLSGHLNVLALGDEDAASLGVAVERTRLWLLFGASLAVAVAVSLCGLVGFVGLIVPHLMRLWLGGDQRLLVPASVLGGASFLMLADVLARLLFRVFHAEPPVGVVTALLGGPFFLALLRSRARA